MFNNFNVLFVCGLSVFISFNSAAKGAYTDIDGVKMYSEYFPPLSKEFSGTIIFENAGGTSTYAWTQSDEFVNCANKYGGLFFYDRSGLGRSSPDFKVSEKEPITAKYIDDKLKKLLLARNIEPPYILVSHSYGGLYSGYFARKRPELVKGMLMVDPTPNDFSYNWESAEMSAFKEIMEGMLGVEHKDLYWEYKNSKEGGNIPPEVFYQMLGFNKTKEQLRSLPAISDKIPVHILSSTFMSESDMIKGNPYELQSQWINHNKSSKITKVESQHFIHLQHPDLTCEIIADIAKNN